MFPDDAIAKHFACGERKAAYLSTFGIAPHFLSLLKGKVRDQSEYVLLFDESLNSEMQSTDKVESQYFTSYFLGHQFVVTLVVRSLLNFPWMVLT